FPHRDMKSVGLVTRVIKEHGTDRELAAVYVPTTPNPTSGYLEIVPVELRKVADGEYRGTLYVDRMLDEDYYGRGVCHWEFTGAGAMLKAT
ncbi:DUF502 domain-containing protein, partial [Stenotrophomonas sp. 3diitr2024]|uniref:DUF502 domain-containing protein n=1 Tax=Stenotrophomonas sp. 3diitr2024 TaxID=3345115 RepID=UPI0035C999A4